MSTGNSPAGSLVLPWKMKIIITLLNVFSDTVRNSDGTINRRLVNFFEPKVPANATPFKGVKTSDITVDANRNLWFRLFTPTEIPSGVTLPVILFFHGGGFSLLSADGKAYDFVCRRFALKLPAVVVSVNYRLSPEHRFPSHYDDGFDTLKFLDESEPEKLGFPANADLSRCFLAGDSAGGNLAHHVAIRSGKADFKKVRVIGQISIQPFFGGEKATESEIRLVNAPIISSARTDWMWKVFLPEGENRDHEAVNVSGPRAVDIRGVQYPETMVVVGGFDPLQDRQREFYEWLKRSGKETKLVEYPNGIHAFYVFPELPESSLFFGEAMDFVRKVCEKEYGSSARM
ncbi:probable carboxylesterase 18 [Macadamia integrifolia]|uniref:probable carboxylesterase 18 n=1 Tax=Macadamia integrifolia TaxID=60698 RepID=UPI001C4F708C|nr:probable carboxylesterase 18 [Macadamia integrifolia]